MNLKFDIFWLLLLLLARRALLLGSAKLNERRKRCKYEQNANERMKVLWSGFVDALLLLATMVCALCILHINTYTFRVLFYRICCCRSIVDLTEMLYAIPTHFICIRQTMQGQTAKISLLSRYWIYTRTRPLGTCCSLCSDRQSHAANTLYITTYVIFESFKQFRRNHKISEYIFWFQIKIYFSFHSSFRRSFYDRIYYNSGSIYANKEPYCDHGYDDSVPYGHTAFFLIAGIIIWRKYFKCRRSEYTRKHTNEISEGKEKKK